MMKAPRIQKEKKREKKLDVIYNGEIKEKEADAIDKQVVAE